jgi:hypothetical protein
MSSQPSVEQILDLAEQLLLPDKLRLLERLAPRVARQARNITRAVPPRSLRGIWKGLDVTDDDIEEVRKEMWGGFPREDV